jgi:transcriptional regulator with XRE-family HTH domain
MTIANNNEQIWQSLEDPEYRDTFVEEEINVGLSFQIKAIRNKQKLTQAELAGLMGVSQPLISQWEDPNYDGKYSLSTLKDLAKVFDVGLLVRFVPFSKLVEWTANLTKESIAPPKFEEEKQSRISTVNLEINSRMLKDVDQIDTSTNYFDKTLFIQVKEVKDKELCLHA